MVGAILAEPGELTEFGTACLEAINCELMIRALKATEEKTWN
jgi:hypothetical protein